MRLFTAIVCFSLSSPAFAFRNMECAENLWLKMGIFRKYESKYTSVELISCRTSGREGITKTSGYSSAQQSTMSLDPGITTGQLYSQMQFTSSFGECSAFATSPRWMEREIFIAENFENLRREIAQGQGEYLSTIRRLSSCPARQESEFGRSLKLEFSKLFGSENTPWLLSPGIDQIIARTPELAVSCEGFAS